MSRATPLDLVFAPVADSKFPRIASSLAEGGVNPAHRDGFLMDREVVTLLRDLRPEEGLGDAMDQMVALVHHAYLTWAAGSTTIPISREMADEVLGPTLPDGADFRDVPAYYAQFPERLIWATVIEGDPPEPLDGCFVSRDPDGDLRVLGVFGLRPDRPGFSAVEAVGPRPEGLTRVDGSPLFAPTLAGGDVAGLRSIMGEEELLELGWRTLALAAEGIGGARWKP